VTCTARFTKQRLLHSLLAFKMFRKQLKLQDVADQLLHKTGGSPLMIRVVAGLLREPDLQGRGPEDADKWRSIIKGLESLLRNYTDAHMKGYGLPMIAYALSVQNMVEREKQLLAVLCFFPAVQEVPTAVVKAVLQGVWTCEDSLFETALQTLQRMNVVDIHQREHYGCKYSEQLNLSSWSHPCMHCSSQEQWKHHNVILFLKRHISRISIC
jgi:hypothetical protein